MDRIAFNLVNGYAENLRFEETTYGVGYQLIVRLITDILVRSGIALFNHIWPKIIQFLRPVRERYYGYL